VVVYGPSLPPFDTITEKIAKTGKEILAKEEIKAGDAVPAIEA
jgi:copper chaperone